ncbi:MAG: dihydropteroate synthase [Acidimicrobiales bacterium]
MSLSDRPAGVPSSVPSAGIAPLVIAPLVIAPLVLPGRVIDRWPVIMGIVNASPDSFSDGGDLVGLDAQVQRSMALVEAGAAIIDVGGESGVTNRGPLQAQEEIDRVLPLVRRLVAEGVTVSVDTWKAPVAEAVLDAGAHILNDVSGLRDPALADLCARYGAGLVLMHTRAEPKKKEFPHYQDVVADVVAFLTQRMEEAEAAGVARERIVVDPGPDFAKTPAQTIETLRRLPEVVALGRPVLLALSRKDFVGALTLRRPRQRDAGTLAAIGAALDAGGAILRVHDVAAVQDYLTVRAALRGEVPVADDLTLPEHLRREPT